MAPPPGLWFGSVSYGLHLGLLMVSYPKYARFNVQGRKDLEILRHASNQSYNLSNFPSEDIESISNCYLVV